MFRSAEIIIRWSLNTYPSLFNCQLKWINCFVVAGILGVIDVFLVCEGVCGDWSAQEVYDITGDYVVHAL
jgi:hypothetical protein